MPLVAGWSTALASQSLEIRHANTSFEIVPLRAVLTLRAVPNDEHYLKAGRPAGRPRIFFPLE